MIKRIKFKNIQVHRNAELELHPGVNTIVGESDYGKSAAMRGIRYVVFNRPSEMTTWGEKECIASIEPDNGPIITRRKKGTTVNSYIIGEEELKNVNRDVPGRVSDILNMGDINFQKQLDRPFLMLSSPGDVAKYLNKISGLEDIDKSLFNIQREYSATKTSLDFERTVLTNREEALKQYENLDIIENILSALEFFDSSFRELNSDLEMLELDGDTLVIIDKKIGEYKKSLPPDVSDILVLIQQYEALDKEYNEVATGFSDLKAISKALSEIPIIPDLTDLRRLVEEGENMEREISDLSNLLNLYLAVCREIDEKTLEYDTINRNYQELSKVVCPTCGRPF